MLVVVTIALVVMILSGYKWTQTLSDTAAAVFGLALLIGGFSFLACLNMRLSTQSLTGYIYSSEDRLGYTTAHIRLSENAGTDVQPSFCVATNSKPGQQIKDLVGSGKKVKISIPPYFYLANNPFACGTTAMTINEVEAK